MISKCQQKNMAILDDEIKFSQNMNEKPKNYNLDKINCDKSTSQSTHPEDDKNLVDHFNESSKSKNCCENIEMKSNLFPSETRIQLSFSVDRLLSDKLQQSNTPCNNPLQHALDTHVHNNDQSSEKCCDELNSSYSCCSLPNCLMNSTCATLSSNVNSIQTSNDEMTTVGPPFNFMDFKSVVRPTPVRVLGNSSESVSPLALFSAMPPSSLIRLHQAHIQQQKQLTQHLPAQTNFTLSSLMNPLCVLKSPQMSTHKMAELANYTATSVNRFNAKVNFDIPIVRPNLACISALRHHHLGNTANNSEAHLNFGNNTNTTTTTAASANTTNINNSNAGNSHGNVGSGKRKRSWSRAVFSNLQRKGLEIQFQQQKYITKPDRRKLAARLNLTDAQVKVWFQNRRMKWRHTRENLKSGQEKDPSVTASADGLKANTDNAAGSDMPGYSSDGSSSLEMSDIDENEDEIDVVE